MHQRKTNESRHSEVFEYLIKNCWILHASVITLSKSLPLRSYIKHSIHVFHDIPITSYFTKNTPLRVAFSALFSMSDM